MTDDTTERRVEAVAKALWRWAHPENDAFSVVAPNDWSRWPETPRAASLAYADFSRQEYREMARAALAALEASNG